MIAVPVYQRFWCAIDYALPPLELTLYIPPQIRTMKHLSSFTAAFGAVALSLPCLNGAVITLGGPLPTARTATLSSALAGAANSTTGSGNATVSNVETFFGGDWTERADGTSAGVNGWLDIQVTSGAFGSSKAGGNWTITNAAFWTTYGVGSISMHVGNGGGEPDHFIWKLTPGTQTGSWSYDGTDLKGGGLSNLKLYSTGSRSTTGIPGVPDGGTTLVSLGVALLGLGWMRKWLAAKA